MDQFKNFDERRDFWSKISKRENRYEVLLKVALPRRCEHLLKDNQNALFPAPMSLISEAAKRKSLNWIK